jgi:D-hexose-6-phosphate mutarotase
MPLDGYQRMLCVEAARVTSTIQVQPAQTWVGWQLLKL